MADAPTVTDRLGTLALQPAVMSAVVLGHISTEPRRMDPRKTPRGNGGSTAVARHVLARG
jgi:hypothetical protein